MLLNAPVKVWIVEFTLLIQFKAECTLLLWQVNQLLVLLRNPYQRWRGDLGITSYTLRLTLKFGSHLTKQPEYLLTSDRLRIIEQMLTKNTTLLLYIMFH